MLNSPNFITRRASLGLLAGAAAVPLLGATPAAAAPTFPGASRVTLDLYQNGDPIGQQRYEITGSQSSPTVSSRAEFQGRFFGFVGVGYNIATVEKWRNGALSQLRSQGQLRGDAFSMRADAQGGGLAVVDEKGRSYTAPASILPTTYWMPNFVRQSQVLDTQRGGLLNIAPRSTGSGSFAGRSVTGWKIGGDLPITIYYDGSGTWSGMQFRVFGADFEYRRV